MNTKVNDDPFDDYGIVRPAICGVFLFVTVIA